MAGIVLELQKEALNENVSIELLLRKAYLVAKKLKLADFEEWLRQEQNGYLDEIPRYREIVGEMKAWNPYHGWVPVIFQPEIAKIVSKMSMTNSISSLIDVYNTSNGSIKLSVNAAVTEMFNRNTDSIATNYAFFASRSEIYRIMSTVRNKILDWALLLEENGIVGEDMTFTDYEKQVASETQVINNYTNNFYSDVTDVDVNQGK